MSSTRDAAAFRWLPVKGFGRQLGTFAVVAALYLVGSMQFLDYRLMDLGFELSRRQAQGAVVVVEIDPASLKQIGVWPWPRRYHAAVLRRLLDSGAERIALAVDLSSEAASQDDSEIEALLKEAGGRIILPVFRQAARRGDQWEVIETAPLPAFRDRALLASANLIPGADALVRRDALSVDLDRLRVPTLGAALAPEPPAGDHWFYIDFGIDPRSIPRISYADVLYGRFDPATVAGKAIVVGPTAVELGENLPVPVHQTLPGPVLHALAYESLVQDRAIRAVAPVLVLVAALVLALVFVPRFARWSWRIGLLVLGGVGAGIVAFALLLHHEAALFLPVSAPLLAVALGYGAAIAGQIDREARRVYAATMAAAHRNAMMRRLIDESFDAIFAIGYGGRIESFNPAAEQMFGYARREVEGTNVAMLLGAPGDHTDGDPIVTALTTGDRGAVGPGVRELIGKRRDGSVFPMEVAITVVTLRTSRHPFERRRTSRSVLICMARDIAERKTIEAAFRRAAQEAEEASRAKTQLIANMSHELRTPLNAIIGFSDMMRQGVFGELGNERYREYAERIGEGGRQLLRVISDILDLANLEARRVVLTEEAVDIRALLLECIASLESQIAARRVRTELRLADDLPVLRADPQALRQALCALVSNAVKFNREGGTVTVTAGLVEDGLAVTIVDGGIGMPSDQIQRLLQPFERLEDSLARRFDGSGLGLPLARALLALHDGVLNIESEPELGTRVSVRFPHERLVPPMEMPAAGLAGDAEPGSGTASPAPTPSR